MHYHDYLLNCYDKSVEIMRPTMKYPLHTQSKPVLGVAAKDLLEAIDAGGGAFVNDRILSLSKRIAAHRRKKQKHVRSFLVNSMKLISHKID